MNFFKLIPYLVFNFVPKFEIAPLVIGGLIGAGASLLGQGINFFSQKKANDQNAAIARQNFNQQQANLDYQKAVQQQTWQREDTAWQRAVQDIQKTGMSPLALSGGAGAGQVVSTTAAQNNFMSSAPQIDAGAVANSAANVTAAIQADKQLKLQTKQMENTVKQQEIENKMKQAEFDQMKLQFDKDYNLRAKGQEEGFKLDWQRIANEIARDAEQTRQFDKRLEHDDALFAWQKTQAEEAATRWKKTFEEDNRRFWGDPDSEYYGEATKRNREIDKIVQDTVYQKHINDFFKTDKGLNLLFRAVQLLGK